MTAQEARREATATIKRKQHEAQEQAAMQYIQAQVFVAYMVRALNGGKGKVPTLEEAYSGIFPKEQRDPVQDTANEQHNAIMEARVIAFAQRWNEAYKKKAGG